MGEARQQNPLDGRPAPGRDALHPALRIAACAALGVAAGLLLRGSGLVHRIDEAAFDLESHAAAVVRPAGEETTGVVLVGLDHTSLEAIGMPIALLHEQIGAALSAVASAAPRAIGLDIALPDRSFDALRPGLDRALMMGLHDARRSTSLVIALDIDPGGRPRPPQPQFVAAAGGPGAFGLPLFPLDCDGVVRRFAPAPGAASRAESRRCDTPADPSARVVAAEIEAVEAPNFAALVAARSGLPADLGHPGWIDFSRGRPFDYVALRDVLAWHEQGRIEPLRARFAGQIVLIGSVLPEFDRLRLPRALAGWEPGATLLPGILVNAQVLRSALAGGLVRGPGGWVEGGQIVLLALIGACAAGTWRRWGVLATTGAAGFGVGVAFYAQGWFLAPGAAVLAGAAAATLRLATDLASAVRGRERLVQALAAYLSPQVLRRVLAHGPQERAERRALACLFADLRGFTAWSERADPAHVFETINRYYERILPAVLALGGSVDNFRGDGIMVMFGAPEPLAEPCRRAFDAARAIVDSVAALERELGEAGGRPPLAVSIGIAFGDAVVGDLGSRERRDFTALGDPVNVAARLHELAPVCGSTVLMTHDVWSRLGGAAAGCRALGPLAVKGHSPVDAYAWP